ncbi:hypothetical protein OIDMADRAFT_33875 [Oidiodendron maius Zn]|uniref:Uncharacterized protein n=1 Tax=Oidiodendron maius (strain Zn) TaxID=913774 RepID=A0A0C3GI26_OIDMZ|nr:hypothetical protein OIDMADRAFT_33875 [Oidiodendron maius Zn]
MAVAAPTGTSEPKEISLDKRTESCAVLATKAAALSFECSTTSSIQVCDEAFAAVVECGQVCSLSVSLMADQVANGVIEFFPGGGRWLTKAPDGAVDFTGWRYRMFRWWWQMADQDPDGNIVCFAWWMIADLGANGVIDCFPSGGVRE